jgi:hypothetical protein
MGHGAEWVIFHLPHQDNFIVDIKKVFGSPNDLFSKDGFGSNHPSGVFRMPARSSVASLVRCG